MSDLPVQCFCSFGCLYIEFSQKLYDMQRYLTSCTVHNASALSVTRIREYSKHSRDTALSLTYSIKMCGCNGTFILPVIFNILTVPFIKRSIF